MAFFCSGVDYVLYAFSNVNVYSLCDWQSSESLRSSWNKKLKVTRQHPFKLRTEVNNKKLFLWLGFLVGKCKSDSSRLWSQMARKSNILDDVQITV